MAARVFVAGLALSMLLACGCGDKGGNPAAEQPAWQQRFPRLLDSGKKALEEQRFEQAVKDFEEAVRLRDDPEARELLLKARNSWDEARKAAFDAAMLRGDQARKEQNYAEAIAAYRDALKQRPDDKEAAAAFQDAEFHDFLENGRTALKNQQYREAIKILAEAVKRQPQDKESRELFEQAKEQRREQVLTQGQAAMQAKQYADAVRCFTEAKELRSDAEVTALLLEANFQPRLQSGRQRLESQQFAAAITDLEEAARLKPDNAEARDLLQKARAEKKRKDKADYDRALEAGDAAMFRKDYQAAIKAYSEALAKQPQDKTASSRLAEANTQARLYRVRQRLEARQFDLAIKELEEAIRLQPDNAVARDLLQKAKEAKKRQDKADFDRAVTVGDAAMLRKDYQAAIKAYSEAKAKQPQDITASTKLTQADNAQKAKIKKESFDRHMSQGKSYMSVKNYAAAVAEFLAARNEDPGNLDANRALLEAQRLLQEGAQKDKAKKDSYNRHISAGKSYLGSKNYNSAESEFRAALNDGVNNSEAQRLLQEAQTGKTKKASYDQHISSGKSYMSSKNYRSAESEFRAALNDGVNNLEAQRLLDEAQRSQRQTPGKR